MNNELKLNPERIIIFSEWNEFLEAAQRSRSLNSIYFNRKNDCEYCDENYFSNVQIVFEAYLPETKELIVLEKRFDFSNLCDTKNDNPIASNLNTHIITQTIKNKIEAYGFGAKVGSFSAIIR